MENVDRMNRDPLSQFEVTVKIRYGADMSLREEQAAFEFIKRQPSVSLTLLELCNAFDGNTTAKITVDLEEIPGGRTGREEPTD